jgi:dihydroxy-acid dehydratase
VLTLNAFSNAIRLNAALGGSVDVAIHLMALAHEAGIQLSLDTFDRIAKETPQICRLGGVGEKEPHYIEDLDRAGGVWAVMHHFKNQILPATTVNGKGALELAKATPVKDSHVINSHRPYAKQSGMGVLKGSLSPKGALFLLNQVQPELKEFFGPVAVYENEVEAAQALSDGKIKKGTALVIRGQGPKGGPGLKKLQIVPALLESKGLNKFIPLITDGRLPDNFSGLFISSVSPEGVTVGPLAVLKDNDNIEINIESRTINVRLTDTELRIRLTRWQSPDTKAKQGFLGRYSRMVSEVHEGAVLK